jgi:hypothetical protein
MELFCEVFDKKGSFQVPPLLVLLLGICYTDRCSGSSVHKLHGVAWL